jgi:hypothetical protein
LSEVRTNNLSLVRAKLNEQDSSKKTPKEHRPNKSERYEKYIGAPLVRERFRTVLCAVHTDLVNWSPFIKRGYDKQTDQGLKDILEVDFIGLPVMAVKMAFLLPNAKVHNVATVVHLSSVDLDSEDGKHEPEEQHHEKDAQNVMYRLIEGFTFFFECAEHCENAKWS